MAIHTAIIRMGMTLLLAIEWTVLDRLDLLGGFGG